MKNRRASLHSPLSASASPSIKLQHLTPFPPLPPLPSTFLPAAALLGSDVSPQPVVGRSIFVSHSASSSQLNSFYSPANTTRSMNDSASSNLSSPHQLDQSYSSSSSFNSPSVQSMPPPPRPPRLRTHSSAGDCSSVPAGYDRSNSSSVDPAPSTSSRSSTPFTPSCKRNSSADTPISKLPKFYAATSPRSHSRSFDAMTPVSSLPSPCSVQNTPATLDFLYPTPSPLTPHAKAAEEQGIESVTERLSNRKLTFPSPAPAPQSTILTRYHTLFTTTPSAAAATENQSATATPSRLESSPSAFRSLNAASHTQPQSQAQSRVAVASHVPRQLFATSSSSSSTIPLLLTQADDGDYVMVNGESRATPQIDDDADEAEIEQFHSSQPATQQQQQLEEWFASQPNNIQRQYAQSDQVHTQHDRRESEQTQEQQQQMYQQQCYTQQQQQQHQLQQQQYHQQQQQKYSAAPSSSQSSSATAAADVCCSSSSSNLLPSVVSNKINTPSKPRQKTASKKKTGSTAAASSSTAAAVSGPFFPFDSVVSPEDVNNALKYSSARSAWPQQAAAGTRCQCFSTDPTQEQHKGPVFIPRQPSRYFIEWEEKYAAAAAAATTTTATAASTADSPKPGKDKRVRCQLACCPMDKRTCTNKARHNEVHHSRPMPGVGCSLCRVVMRKDNLLAHTGTARCVENRESVSYFCCGAINEQGEKCSLRYPTLNKALEHRIGAHVLHEQQEKMEWENPAYFLEYSKLHFAKAESQNIIQRAASDQTIAKGKKQTQTATAAAAAKKNNNTHAAAEFSSSQPNKPSKPVRTSISKPTKAKSFVAPATAAAAAATSTKNSAASASASSSSAAAANGFSLSQPSRSKSHSTLPVSSQLKKAKSTGAKPNNNNNGKAKKKQHEQPPTHSSAAADDGVDESSRMTQQLPIEDKENDPLSANASVGTCHHPPPLPIQQPISPHANAAHIQSHAAYTNFDHLFHSPLPPSSPPHNVFTHPTSNNATMLHSPLYPLAVSSAPPSPLDMGDSADTAAPTATQAREFTDSFLASEWH